MNTRSRSTPSATNTVKNMYIQLSGQADCIVILAILNTIYIYTHTRYVPYTHMYVCMVICIIMSKMCICIHLLRYSLGDLGYGVHGCSSVCYCI